jgi:hypothetical protein
MVRRCVGVIVVLGALVLAACGGDDDEGDAAPVSSTEEEEADAGDAGTADPGDDAADDDAGDDSAGDDEADLTVPQFDVVNDGTCSVSVTGDKQAEWTGGGTIADVLVSYWLTEEEAEFLGDDAFTILFNCTGPSGDSISIFNGQGGTADNIPQAPGSYPLQGGFAEGAVFASLLTLTDSETNWGITDEGGTLEITRFDDERIAGTFTASMEDTLAELSGEESEGAIVVTGSFDFPNT